MKKHNEKEIIRPPISMEKFEEISSKANAYLSKKEMKEARIYWTALFCAEI